MTDEPTLIERLRKRAKKERDIAANSTAVFGLLKPEYDKWDAHEGPFNLYAVRMAVDHKLSAEKDTAFADDLDEAADALERALKDNSNAKDSQ